MLARQAIIYGSVCSGIEAASLAWECLDFKPCWFAEIEPFPSAVLAYHWPKVPNLGDMTKLAAQVLSGRIPAPDVLVGGTPCQAFSVAGMREGLADPRGALTIKYVELADAADLIRARSGKPESIIVWENVPGVLSDKGNAFGCFLGALAGEDCELQPAGEKWTDAGCVYGPKRTIAWRVLDAQYFGLAQRRRRVFVVASARAGFDPLAVLFEREGVRRDTAPRRGEGQELAGSITASLGRSGGAPDCGSTAGQPQAVNAYGGGRTGGPVDVAACLVAKGQKCDFEVETFIVQDYKAGTFEQSDLSAPLRTNPASGPDGVGVQADHAYTLEARAEVQAVAVALRGREGGATAELGDDLAGTLRASTGGGDKAHALVSQAVRRLTPTECERLQGFQDDYTMIPWRGKPAEECPDGPRYKAIGNSKAVPVVRWIGRRIKQQLEVAYG